MEFSPNFKFNLPSRDNDDIADINKISENFETIDSVVKDLEIQVQDLQEFVGYKDDYVFGVEVDFLNNKFTRLSGSVDRTPGGGFNDIPCFGGRKRCNVTDSGKVVAYYGDSGFTTTGKLTQKIVINEGENAGTYIAGTFVQTMVEQPKFYYKVVPMLLENTGNGQIARKIRYYVSPVAKAGFKLHPAFVSNGKTLDKIYLSAFEGCIFNANASVMDYILDDSQVDSFTGGINPLYMLSSIANAKPASGLTQDLTRANTRFLAHNRGTGWEQAYAATVSASQLLMLIEYASFNMQTAIGSGVTNKTDDGANNLSENTGATISLGNNSGSVTNTTGYNCVSYRGEENLWGNMFTWVDGINEQNPENFASGDYGDLFVADHSFSDDTSNSPYENTNLHPSYGNGYISAFCYSEDFDWMFIPGETSGSSSLPVGDASYNSNSGWRASQSSGAWSVGSGAGAFYFSLSNNSSHHSRNLGGRLVYIPK